MVDQVMDEIMVNWQPHHVLKEGETLTKQAIQKKCTHTRASKDTKKETTTEKGTLQIRHVYTPQGMSTIHLFFLNG